MTDLVPLAPAMPINELFAIDACVAVDQRQKNVDFAFATGFPFVMMRQPRNAPLAIVGSGPSVKDYIEALKIFPGEIWAINGAFNWLRSVGIKPTAFLGMDPDPILVNYLTDPQKDATYYIASQCDPSVFRLLKDHNVWIWHAHDPGTKPKPGNFPIPGGSTLLTRAPYLGSLLGFSDVHIFGGDSSYIEDGYVYGGKLIGEGDCVANFDGIEFKTNRQMLAQATEMMNTLENFPGDITVHGSGLMPSMAAVSAQNHERYKAAMAKVWKRMERNRKRAA
jgi:hypothetical protein